jgi:hypothetical protein
MGPNDHGNGPRRQRPKKTTTAGKKTHTHKNLMIAQPDQRTIVYLGPTTPGSVHDKKMADTEQICYPLATLLFQDTGFQGYSPQGVSIQQPKKKPRGKDLSVGERFFNGVLSSFRIVVEHCISGAKRARILKEVFRNTKDGFADLVMEVACALHNLRVEFRHPRPQFDLRELAMESYSR